MLQAFTQALAKVCGPDGRAHDVGRLLADAARLQVLQLPAGA